MGAHQLVGVFGEFFRFCTPVFYKTGVQIFVSQLKINPLLCRGREDLQIKVKTRARIKVGLQTTNKLTREVCQMGTENSLDNMK